MITIALTTVCPQTYPDGYPESLLPKLGSLVSFITPEDVSKWKITSADTLAGLLKNRPADGQVGFGFAFLPMFAFWFGSCWFRTSLVGSKMIDPSLRSKQIHLK